MPSKLDPHVATIEDWLAAEPQLTALAIVRSPIAIRGISDRELDPKATTLTAVAPKAALP